MDPLAVLANEFARRFSDAQFAEPPSNDRLRRQGRAAGPRRLPRRRRRVRAFRRVAEALLD